MDSGMAWADQPAPSLPPPTLPLPHLIAVFDELICGEMSWYNGLPLLQTIFRLDWLHVSRTCTEPTLSAAMLAAARSAMLVRQLVLRADIAQEEDFSPACFGLDLCDDFSAVKVLHLLLAAEKALQGEVEEGRGRARSGTGSGAGSGAGSGTRSDSAGGSAMGEAASRGASQATDGACLVAIVPSPAAPTTSVSASNAADVGEVALLEAMLCRVRLRRALFVVVSQLTRPGTKAVEALRRVLTVALSELSTVRASVGLGASAGLECLEGRASAQLSTAAPQRKVELPTRLQALEALAAMVAQLQAVCSIVDVQDYNDIWRWLLVTTRGGAGGDISACGGELGVVVRSYVALAGVSEERHTLRLRTPLAPQLWAAIGELNALSPELWREIAQVQPCGERLYQLTQHQLSLMRLCCFNRGRERRKLRVFLEEWAPLQELCDALDAQLQGAGLLERGVAPFGKWTLTATVGVMLRFLLLGFELDLHAPCEYHMIYWRIECLCHLRVRLYESVLHSAKLQAVAVLKRVVSASSQKKARPAKLYLRSAIARCEALRWAAMRDLCCGLGMLLTQLVRRRLLPTAELEFTTLATRFEKRFSAFKPLTQPACLPLDCYESLIEDTMAALSTGQLGRAAVSLFKQAKAKFDKLVHDGESPLSAPERAELAALTRVAVGNSVFVMSELCDLDDMRGQRAHFDFGSHACFPLVSLVPLQCRTGTVCEPEAEPAVIRSIM